MNKSNSAINILFIDQIKINIVATENTKIIDLIRLFFYKINRPDLAANYKDKVSFIFNGKKINEYSQQTIRELNIKNFDKIYVIYYNV